MVWNTRKKEDPVRDALNKLCAKAERVRIRVLAATPETVSTYSRFLHLGEDQLLFYWPSDHGSVFANKGIRVECFFEYRGLRCAFQTQTRGRLLHMFKHGGQAAALSVALPEAIKKKQQREAFRVSVLDLPNIHVTPIPDDETIVPPDYKIRMVNVSISGMGALVECARHQLLSVRSYYHLKFRLPDCEMPFDIRSELVHCRPLGDDGTRFFLGWRFSPPPDCITTTQMKRELEKFIAARQRQLLKKVNS